MKTNRRARRIRRTLLLCTGLSVGAATTSAASPALAAGGQPAFPGAHLPSMSHVTSLQPVHGAVHQSAASTWQNLPASFHGQQLAGTLPMPGSGVVNFQAGFLGRQQLDLSSSNLNIVLNANVLGKSSVTIEVGGESKTFSGRAHVTAGEYVAIKEVLGGGTQTITLDGSGAATAGYFSLNSIASPQVSNLLIPQGVTGIDYVSSSKALGVSGNILNFGSIYGVSTSQAFDATTIYAKNITNETGGTISTALPGWLSAANPDAISQLNLTLIAAKDITNHGIISSTGNLTLATAGGSIINAPLVGAGSAAPAPTMTAAGDVNLLTGSGNIVNYGAITASRGNINIAAVNPATDINIAAAGGSFNALNGDITMRDASYNGAANINMTGGDYFSENLNLYSGTGNITGVVGDVTGKLNSIAGADHLAVQTKTFHLGNNKVGDPTFVNIGGDIVVDGVNTFTEDVAILATGSILDSGLGDSQIVANGFNVTMIAGAGITLSGAGGGGDNSPSVDLSAANVLTGARSATVDFSKGVGGNIDFSTSAAYNVIDTSGVPTVTGSAGGNVTLVAKAVGANGGNVLFDPGSFIYAFGTSNLSGGNVTIYAGSNVAGTTISLGSINTGAGGYLGNGMQGGNSGNITIATVQPGFTTATFNTKGVMTAGSITAGTVSGNAAVNIGGDLETTAPGLGNLFAKSIQQSSNGGNIAVTAGSDITVAGGLFAYGQGGLGGTAQGGGQGGKGGNGGTINVTTTNGSITIGADVNSSGGGGGGGGGADPTKAILTGLAGGAGGTAGTIVLQANNGSVSVAGNVYAVDGGAGGAGGNASGVGNFGGGGGGGGSFGGGGGGAGDGIASGGAGGGGQYGGGGGAAPGAGGGGFDTSATIGFQGGGFGNDPSQDGSQFTGGPGLSGATGGTLTIGGTVPGSSTGGQGGVGQGTGGTGLTGASAPLSKGTGADVTITANSNGPTAGGIGLAIVGEIIGRNVTLQSPTSSGGNVDLAAAVTGTTSVTLKADGVGAITQSTGIVTTPALTMTSGSGDIGNFGTALATQTQSITATTTGNVYISNTGSVTLNASSAGNNNDFYLTVIADPVTGDGQITIAGNVKAAAGTIGQIYLQSDEAGASTGGIAQTAGTLTATNVDLADTSSLAGSGAIGSSSNPILTAATNLSANTQGDVFISNAGGVNLGNSLNTNITGNNVTVTATGTITSAGGNNGSITAFGALTLNAPTINVGAGDTYVANNALTINGAAGSNLVVTNPTQLLGASVSINGVAGKDVTINNTGDIQATNGNVSITSSPSAGVGGNLTITGTGTMDASNGTINLTAVASGALTNKISFTGAQTFNGTAILSATGANQQVSVTTVAVTGNDTVVLNSPLLTLNTGGTLTGNPLILAAGTIANSGASLDLSSLGTLVFSGRTLAVLSAGDIKASSPVTIDLSNASGAGGQLNLIAGFNFTPTTSGTQGPDLTGYTLGSAGTGNINLSNATIKTTGTSTGGSVLAVATGSVALGAITTTGGTGTSGGVTVFGQGITVGGMIDTSNTTASKAGSVTLTSGAAKTVGTVTVQYGAVLTGSFAANTSTKSVSLAGIKAGTPNVSIDAQGTGSAITSSATIAATNLILTSGSGGIGTSLVPLPTAATNLQFNSGTGDSFISNTGAFSVTAGNGNNITLTSSGTFTAGGTLSAGAAFTATAPTVTVSAGNSILGSAVTINAPSNTDLLVSNAGTISGNSVTINGAAGKDVTISNSNKISAISGNLNITSSINAGVGGNLNIGGGGTLSATNLINLTASTAAGGANNITFTGDQTFTGTTNLFATGAGQVVQVNNAVTVTGQNTVNVAANLKLVGTGKISGNPLNLNPGQTIASTADLDLSSFGSLTFSGRDLAIISAGNISESSPVTIDLSKVGGTGGSLTLVAGYNFTPTTAGVVGPDFSSYTFTTAGTGIIDLKNATILTGGLVGGNVTAIATGSIALGSISTIGTAGTSGTVTLLGSGVSATGSIDTSNATAANAGAINITSGPIVKTGTPGITFGAITGGSFKISAPSGSIALAGTNTGAAVSLTGGGTGSITSSATINGGSLTMVSGSGGIGSSGSPLPTAVSQLTINNATTADAFLSNTGALTLGPSTGKNINIQNDAAITTGGGTTATAILTLTAPSVTVKAADTLQGSSVVINGAAGAALTLNNAGNITGGSVTVDGTSGKDVTLNNSGTITASTGNLNVTSTPSGVLGGNLTVLGGGNLVAALGTINLTATASGTDSNIIDFTGNQTFTGSTVLSASGSKQSVQVESGVSVVGKNAVVIISPLLQLNGGTLKGNPLIANALGTIANSTGPLDLSKLGPIVYNGQSLAILSAGDITDSGSTVSIDLSNKSGDAGSLTLIAGFNFTPTTGGVTKGPDLTLYTLGTAATGNIVLGNTTISTTGSGKGGDVSAVATGSVTLGAVTTSGGSGTSGNVSIIGNGVTDALVIDTTNGTPANTGSVTIFSGTPTTVGTVTVQYGIITGGSFTGSKPQGSIALGGINAAGGTVQLTGGGSGSVTSTSLVVADTLNVTSGTGGIGGGGSLPVQATNLSIGNANTADANILSLGGVTLHTVTGNNITIRDDLSISTAGSTTAGGALNLTTIALNVAASDTLKGASVLIQSPIGSDLTVDNKGTITATATTLNIKATPDTVSGGNLNIQGGGTMNATAGSINLTAVTNGTMANKIDFKGSQTFNGLTTLNAAGTNQSVAVEAGAKVVGNNEVDVFSPLLSLNGGTISGNPLVIRPAGTIANSKGPLDLSTFGVLTYSGQTLAILSAGDIIDNNQPVTINTSSAGSVGGSLTLIAGYNFTPATVGTVGPNNTNYTITTPGTGAIKLGNTAILTNGATAGGNVVAVATGAITLGTVKTSGGSGTGGSVTVIGNGITINGLVDTSSTNPANSGAITLFSGSATVNGTVHVQNGAVPNGAFTPNLALAGISLQGINAGTGNVTLTGGGSGAISSGPNITAGTLVMTSGTGGIGTASNSINTSASTITANAATGNAYIVALNPTTLTGTNAGTIFELVGVGNVTVASVPTANNLTLASGGVLNFASSSVAVNPDSKGQGGTLTLSAPNLSWTSIATQPLSLSADGGPSGNGGSISVTFGTFTVGNAAGNVSFSAQGNALGGNGGTVSIASSGAVTIDSAGLKLGPQSASGNGGTLQIFASSITNAKAGALVLDVSGKGTGNGGSVSVEATSGPLTIGTAAGQIQFIANSGASGGNAGSITVTSDSGAVTVNTAGLQALAQGANGDGGSIGITGQQIINGGAGVLALDVSGTGTGNGGGVAITSKGAGNNINIGTTAGDISVDASGGATGGNGGQAVFFVNGTLDVDVAGLKVAPVAGTGNGGVVDLAANSITWPNQATSALLLDASGFNGGNGGLVSVTINGASPITIGSNKGDIQINAQSGANGGGGGSAVVSTQGAITIDTSAILVGPRGASGNGGSIQLTASGLNFPGTAPLVLNGSAKGTGNGGVVGITLTDNAPVTVGNLAGNIQLIANGGSKNSAGGNGGRAYLITGGPITVNPVGLNVNPLGKLGNGGNISLNAGTTLLVNGALTANGIGKTGVGGSISLTSNSSIPFAVGSTVKGLLNGTTRVPTVKSMPTNGVLAFSNNGGDVTNAAAISGFSSLTMSANGAGSVIVGANMGDSKTALVQLTTLGAGDVKSSKTTSTVIGADVQLKSSGTGSIGTASIPLAINAGSVEFSAPSGMVNVVNKSTKVINVSGSAGSAVTLSSGAKIVVAGPISAGNSISLKATGAANINEKAIGDVLTSPIVILTAGGGGIGTTQPLEVNTPSLTANSSGVVNIKSVGIAPISLAGAAASKSFTLSSSGDIDINGNIGTTAALVNIVAGGSGNIVQVSGVVNGKTVSLGAALGNIGAAGTPIEVSSASISANTGGSAFVDDKAKATAIIRNSSAADLIFTTTAATTINNLTATNGSISVTNSTGTLQTNKNAVLTETSATTGGITLQNNNATGGSIALGAGTRISTLTTTGGGDVVLTIGAPVKVAGTAPAKFITVNKLGTTGGVFFGDKGITTSAPTNTLNYKDANIVFSTASAKLTSHSIKLNGNVVITADPIAAVSANGQTSAAVMVMPVVNDTAISAGSAITAPPINAVPVSGALAQPATSTFGMSPITPTFGPSIAPALAAIANTPAIANTGALTLGSAGLNSVSGARQQDSIIAQSDLSAMISSLGTSPLRGGVQYSSRANGWISATELTSGHIPGMVVSDEDLGISSDTTAGSAVDSDVQNKAAASRNASVPASRRMTLRRGTILLTPSADTTVETAFGEVSVAGRSVVLVMAHEYGVSVYNMDDSRKGAVTVKAGGMQKTLSPGKHVSITTDRVRRFEDINPAQLFGYRLMSDHNLGGGKKLYTSEFSVAHALRTVLPLKQLVASTNPSARKVADHLLKTTAIMLQLNGGVMYEQKLRPSALAYRN